MVSTAFRIEVTKDELPSTVPYITFIGKIYSRPKQDDNDCIFGIDITEYNNFNFTNKGRITFKIQTIYEADPDSRFRKLTTKLEIGKLIFIAGLLDLSDDDLPFVDAKEIDLLEDSTNNLPNTSSQSLFSRTQKFKTNKIIPIKIEKSLDNTVTQDQENSDDQPIDDEIEHKSETNSVKRGSKRKNELADLSIQCLKKAKNLDKNKEESDNNEKLIQPIKRGGKKKKELANNNKSLKKT